MPVAQKAVDMAFLCATSAFSASLRLCGELLPFSRAFVTHSLKRSI